MINSNIIIMNRNEEKLSEQERELRAGKNETKEATYKVLKKKYLLNIVLPLICSVVLMVGSTLVINHTGGGGLLKFFAYSAISLLTIKLVLNRLKKLVQDVPEFAEFISGKDIPANLRLNSFLIGKTVETAAYEKRYVGDDYLLVPTAISCKDENGDLNTFYVDIEDWNIRKTNKEFAYVDMDDSIIFCPEINEDEANDK